MCGIVANFSDNPSVILKDHIIKGMLDTIAHRGPDGSGILKISETAIIGHRRLAVIDVKSGGQPMVSADGRYSLVFNGEIYNYIELRQELLDLGYKFNTDSDTEVLLISLIKWGIEALKKLNGMFAFVLHDRMDGAWIAARDHFGIKPLYYADTGFELIFASEIKALLAHPSVKACRDEKALHQYLTFQFCLDDRTLFSGIHKIKPAHFLAGKGNEIKKEECYWDVDYRIDVNTSGDEFEEH